MHTNFWIKEKYPEKKIPCPNREAPDCSLSRDICLSKIFCLLFGMNCYFIILSAEEHFTSGCSLVLFLLFTCFSFSPGLTKRKLTYSESKLAIQKQYLSYVLRSVYFKMLHLLCIWQPAKWALLYMRKVRWKQNGIYKEKEKSKLRWRY